MAKKKQRGHYCRVCGRQRANEKFSGTGHVRHICRDCEREQRQARRKRKKTETEDQPVLLCCYCEQFSLKIESQTVDFGGYAKIPKMQNMHILLSYRIDAISLLT